jgi:acyl-CoA synthetase (AMP-forming)/AMP-acid ligase II
VASQKIPEEIMLVGALPRNAMGKILKNSLRQQYRGHEG